MRRLGLALVLTASVCSAQDSGDFKPATTNVWGAQYPRVDAKGRVEIRIKAARRHEGPRQLLERAQGGDGEAARRVLDVHDAAARSPACTTTR